MSSTQRPRSTRALPLSLLALLSGCDPSTGSDAGPELDAAGAADAGGGSDTPSLDGGVDFTPGVVPTEAPAWVTGLVPGTWNAISLDTVRDHDPAADPALNPRHPDAAPWSAGTGLQGMMTAWGGGALASGHGTHGTFLVYGGGHGDYTGSR